MKEINSDFGTYQVQCTLPPDPATGRKYTRNEKITVIAKDPEEVIQIIKVKYKDCIIYSINYIGGHTILFSDNALSTASSSLKI